MAAGAVVVAAAVMWLTRPPDLPRVPIDMVFVAPGSGERTLEVHLRYSSCQELVRLHVDETLNLIRMIAYVHDLVTCGTVDTTSQVVTIRLELPLRGRLVVDDTTGAPLAVAS
ncbi:hypothetical protein OHA72_40290 [Dactylosporangium sp. NBC_01737]|uniref:hypothetical protein n=1 Tax=Dactylosporangium sp. NBC_01737 TaxID=2975959 RepID=UPI002E13C965|nr:hypothetical protein OHA72_40290 [Dactylosporangium sp. NBC_01737]